MAETSTLTLAEIETAIRNILLGGQSFSSSGVSMTRAALPELYAARDRLLAESARVTNGISFVDDFGAESR